MSARAPERRRRPTTRSETSACVTPSRDEAICDVTGDCATFRSAAWTANDALLANWIHYSRIHERKIVLPRPTVARHLSSAVHGVAVVADGAHESLGELRVVAPPAHHAAFH